MPDVIDELSRSITRVLRRIRTIDTQLRNGCDPLRCMQGCTCSALLAERAQIIEQLGALAGQVEREVDILRAPAAPTVRP